MSRARIHLDAGGDTRIGVCGVMGRVTSTASAVTCRLCLARIPVPAWEVPPAEPARYGARELSRADEIVVRRSMAGVDHQRREGWVDARAAICAWAEAHDAGSLLMTSSSSTDRFGSRARGAARGSETAAMAATAHVARVASALETAYADTLVAGEVRLVPLAQRAILEMRVAGRAIRRGLRRDCVVRVECSAEETAEHLAAITGQPVTARHVALVVRHGLDAVDATLRARGLLFGRPRGERSEPAAEWTPRARRV